MNADLPRCVRDTKGDVVRGVKKYRRLEIIFSLSRARALGTRVSAGAAATLLRYPPSRLISLAYDAILARSAISRVRASLLPRTRLSGRPAVKRPRLRQRAGSVHRTENDDVRSFVRWFVTRLRERNPVA